MKLFKKSSSKNLKVRLLASVACLGLIAGIVWTLFNPVESDAAWYDESYAYRAKQTIGNTGSADSNKKVKLDIDTATLITAGKMQSDCDDTRFTDINGKQLQYFLDSAGGACNGASTDYYVLVPTINAGTTILYMYYGNAQASSGSQPTQFSQATFSPTSGPTAASEEQGPAPRLFWKLDESQGTTVNDTTRNNNSGTLGASTAAPTWQPADQCAVGTCLKFDGTNDYISRSYSSDTELAPGTASFSVSVWFRHSTANLAGNNMLLTRSASGIGYKVYMNSSEQMCFGVDDVTGSFPSDSACSTTTYNDSQWHFLEAVKSGTSSITVYIDGRQAAQDASLSATGSLSASSPTLYLGIDSDGTSTPWDGFIDEVKYYDSARSAAQVQTDFSAKSAIGGTTASFGNNVSSNLDSGLVGYWKMDETSWTNDCSTTSVTDSSGNANNGTSCPSTTGSTGGVQGKFSLAGTFDGSDDYVNLGDSSSLHMDQSKSMTFSVWVNPSSLPASTTAKIIRYDDCDAADGDNNCTRNLYNLSLDVTGMIAFYFGPSSGLAAIDSGTTFISANSWSLITATRDVNSKLVKLYINGALVGQGTDTTTGTWETTGQYLELGRYNTSATSGGVGNFAGKMDEVRIYNRSLSNAEVIALYDWGPGPIAYWNMDERTGQTVNDKSSNNYSGTLGATSGSSTDDPTWGVGKYGGGLVLDGTDDMVDFSTNVSSLNLGEPMTFMGWVKPTVDDDVIFYLVGSVGNPLFRVDIGNNVTGTLTNELITILTNTTGGTLVNRLGYTTATRTELYDGKWHHIAVSSDGSAYHIYLDGVEKTITVGAGSNNGDMGPMSGANLVRTQATSGTIDEFKVYNYTRTLKQIIQDMHASASSVGGVGTSTNTVAYWNLDEGQGTTANDKSGKDNSLTLNTATSAWTSSGKFGNAWNGLGANWLTRADDDDLDFAANDDFSISLWLKSDSATNPSGSEYVLSKLESSAGYRIRFNTSGQVGFGVDDDTTFTPDDEVISTADVYDNAWHNIVAIKRGTSRVDLYVDGILVASDTSLAATGTLANSIAVYLGDRNGVDGGDEFNGDIDEVKFYRYALNSEEVKAEFNQGSSQSIGSVSTASSGTTADNSAARQYCVPGDTTSCSAPLGDWKLDERTGTSVKDTSGNGLNGTLNGTATWTTGKIGASVNFTNASGEHIDIGDIASLDFGASSDFTLEAWVNRAAAVEQDAIIEKKNVADSCSSDPGYSFYITTAGLAKFRACDATDTTYNVESTTTLSNGTWYHVVFVWDDDSSSGTRMYVNGKNDTGNVSGTITSVGDLTNALSLRIGSESDGGKTMNGKLDQVKIYNYARTPAQIAWSYNQGGPVAWYKFDECSSTTANDASGNSNTGTITIGSSGTYTSIGTCNSGTSTEAWNAGSTGKFGSSIALDDTDDYVDMGDLTAMEGISQASWTFWAKPTVTNACIFCKANSDGTQSAWRFTPGTGLRAYLSSTSTNYGETVKTYINGSWVHAAVVFDGTQTGNSNRLKIYLDGKSEPLTFSGTIPAATAATTSNARLNSYSNGSSFSRSLYDDVRMYNYPLTEVQVRNVYNEGSSVRMGQ